MRPLEAKCAFAVASLALCAFLSLPLTLGHRAAAFQAAPVSNRPSPFQSVHVGPPGTNGVRLYDAQFSSLLQAELAGLPTGLRLIEAPNPMRAGIPSTVRVRIGRVSAEMITQGLQESKLIVRDIKEIPVGTFMKVRLKPIDPQDFTIEDMSEQGQVVAGNAPTEWLWTVIPLQAGIHKLRAMGASRT